MVDREIKTLLERSQRDLAELVRQRDRLNVEIIKAQSQVRGLSAMAWRNELLHHRPSGNQSFVGITEAIRAVLRLRNKAMKAAEVKADLEMMGYDFREFSNPSAMVHNTLKRMAENGELLRDKENKTFQLHSTLFGK